jgi:hypothetical protein
VLRSIRIQSTGEKSTSELKINRAYQRSSGRARSGTHGGVYASTTMFLKLLDRFIALANLRPGASIQEPSMLGRVQGHLRNGDLSKWIGHFYGSAVA